MGDIIYCGCGCGMALPEDRQPNRKYLTVECRRNKGAELARIAYHKRAYQKANPGEIVARFCICGCKERLPVGAHSARKYLSEKHRQLHRKQLNVRVSYEPIACKCGCGEMFTPSSLTNKFVSEKHRDHYHTNVAKKKVEEKVGFTNRNTMVRHATEAVKAQNRETIDRQIGEFLAGNLEPIKLIPGGKKITDTEDR